MKEPYTQEMLVIASSPPKMWGSLFIFNKHSWFARLLRLLSGDVCRSHRPIFRNGCLTSCSCLQHKTQLRSAHSEAVVVIRETGLKLLHTSLICELRKFVVEVGSRRLRSKASPSVRVVVKWKWNINQWDLEWVLFLFFYLPREKFEGIISWC